VKDVTLSLQSRTIAIACCEPADQRTLERQFRRLGARAHFLAALPDFDIEPRALADFDLFLFDSDRACDANQNRGIAWPDLPRVAIVGTETPSRLRWIMEQQVSGHLHKPVHYGSVLSTCLFAMRAYRQMCVLSLRVEKLEDRVRARRSVFEIQLKLMHDLNLSADEAFNALRTLAMSRQLSVEQLSVEMLGAAGGAGSRA
jgi:two-component system, response regulator PdtaR